MRHGSPHQKTAVANEFDVAIWSEAMRKPTVHKVPLGKEFKVAEKLQLRNSGFS